MRKGNRFSWNPKVILSICAVGCAGTMFISFRYPNTFKPVSNAIFAVVTPMQKGINTIGSTISDKLDQFQNINDLIEENEQLKEQVDALSYEMSTLQQDKYELESLRELYELDQQYSDYPKVAARVIQKDTTSNWYSTFKIDKGLEDGLTVDMNVIAGNGLVGIITEVHQNYSIVRSIIDDKSNISGMFLETSDTCIVEGNLELLDDGVIDVSEISKDADIEDGYSIVTSYISEKYLQGILIGYVSDIEVDANNMTMSAYLTPAVDFSKLENVLVITQVKEQLVD